MNMIEVDLSRLGKINKNHGLSKGEIGKYSGAVPALLKKIESRKQGFYKVIDERSTVKKINDFAVSVRGKYSDIVVLGIGGSALGISCLGQSLKHLYETGLCLCSCKCGDNKCGEEWPRLHVLDNIDPAMISEIQDVVDYRSTLFIVVTKSGTTPETMAQYFYFRDNSDKLHLKPKDHFVFITDPEKGTLRTIAKKEKIPCFEIPSNVGGRFSVMTAVGLLPAKLIGIDIEKMLKGAQKMRDSFLNKKFAQNLPCQLAAVQYLLTLKGKNINVLMPYSQKLIRFADWFGQLLAESTGKKGKGITPSSALGATDQHSQSQLYHEGPNDKLIIFIGVDKMGAKLLIPASAAKEPELKFLKNSDFETLLRTEMKGTVASLTKNDRPNITIKISKVDEESLGMLFMLFEGATAYLCEMMGINAFDQPGVELSKKITKELLLKKK